MPKNEIGRKVLYPSYEVRLFHKEGKNTKGWQGISPLTEEVAKEILGWQSEKDTGTLFEDDYLLADYGGEKIRCLHNLNNRPFYGHLAEAWKLETLRKKWKCNGESIIIDKYGNVHDGQHRLTGLVLACQEWRLDQEKPKDEQIWSQFWTEEPYLETFVVLGIEGDDTTVNTIGTGKPRTFTDVMFRSEYFDGLKNSSKKNLAKTTDWAIRLVWDRTAQKQVSYCPKRSHSESMDFIARHERILQAVRFIYELNKKQDKFQHLITLGYAAGLLYLMGTATSDYEKYELEKNEKGLSFKLWDKATQFWKDLANNGAATEPLRELLLKIPPHVQGSYGRDKRVGMIIKGWNLYVEGEKITTDAVTLDTYEDKIGVEHLAEKPKIGGIDLDYSPPIKQKVGKTINQRKAEEGTKGGECLKGGKHEWVKDDDGEYCSKCLETKLVKRRK